MQFKTSPLVVVGGAGLESQRQGGGPEADLGMQVGGEGNSRVRCLA